jgi:hypothetical protein
LGYYNRNSQIYSQMAIFQVKYKKKPAGHLQKLLNENYIKERNQSVSSIQIDVEIICGSIDCKYGNELEGKLFSMKEALENSIIPYDKCTNELGCLCLYGITPRRDENGNLIFTDDHLVKKESKKKKGFWSGLFS